MAARNRVGLAENTRKRIQATMIVKALMDHVSGNNEMSATQVNAARILLNKVLPDLRDFQLSGDDESPLTLQIVQYADNQDTK